jgi:uncharacterized protein (TIGR02302 family)
MKTSSGRPDSREVLSPRALAYELDRKVRRARLVIFLERLWPAIWAPIGVAGVFLLLSLFGLWAYLDFQLHRGALWGFGAAFVVSLIPLIRVRWPGKDEGLRRLETTSGLPHRPATSYQDTLSDNAPSPVTNRIWITHRQRLAKLFSLLRAGWPVPRTDRWDPFALRTLLVLLLTVGFVAHHDDAASRIRAAFDLKPDVAATIGRIDAWITPPVYTGQPPVMVSDGSRTFIETEERKANFTVPEQSELTVRINHPNAARFALRMVPRQPVDQVPPPVASHSEDDPNLIQASVAGSGATTAQFKQTLTDSAVIEVLDDNVAVARWAIELIDDTPPYIELAEEPKEAQRGSLRFKYKVEDDYGVLSAQAQFARIGGVGWDEDEDRPANVKRLGDAPRFPLSLPRANTKKGDGQTYRDLTSHFWAGLPVTVTLEAHDQGGQIGFSQPVRIDLPQRNFSKPLARALIEQRKRLVDRPDRKERVVEALNALTIAPEIFTKETPVYLGLRSAFWRLTNTSDEASLESVANLLWEIAVQIEDGDLSDAERKLRTAQENLMKALEDGASDEELKRLMDELRTALNEFMQTLAQQAQQNPNFDPQFSPERMLSQQDLERMLKQIEDLAKTGSKDAAKQMLSQLRDMLENLQGGQQQAQDGRAQQMMRNLDELSNLIGKQQQLLDETFRARQQGREGQEGENGREGQEGRQGQSGQKGEGQQQGGGGKGQNPFPGLRQEQGALQDQLKKLMEQLERFGSKQPNQLDGADQAMGDAGEALGQENAGQATEQQTLALDRLRQGAQAMAEQMMRQMGQTGQTGRAYSGNGDRDPLGRPMPTQGLDDGDSVKVPEESDIQRARQILEELRRRLGEQQRLPQELDYIERLIERF